MLWSTMPDRLGAGVQTKEGRWTCSSEHMPLDEPTTQTPLLQTQRGQAGHYARVPTVASVGPAGARWT